MVGDMLRKAANKQASPGSPMTDFTPETEVSKEVCAWRRMICLLSAVLCTLQHALLQQTVS